jgi:hypothetical protein
VFPRVLQPVKDLQPAVIGQGPQDPSGFHIDS